MIIDIHTHIYNEETYKTYFAKAKNRISKVLVMAWYEEDFKVLLDFAAGKNNVFLAGTVDVEKNIEEQLRILEKLFQEKRVIGIKLYPGYQYFYPSDEKIFPIAELCQKYNKPLIFHSGDIYDQENKAILKFANPIYVDGLAVKFPECKMIIAHFGFPYHMEAANVVSKNKNVFTDISGTIDASNFKKSAENLLNQYIADLQRVFFYFPDIKNKVMFGTDYIGEDTPLREVISYIKLAKKVFSKDEQGNVFHKLAESLFFEDKNKN